MPRLALLALLAALPAAAQFGGPANTSPAGPHGPALNPRLGPAPRVMPRIKVQPVTPPIAGSKKGEPTDLRNPNPLPRRSPRFETIITDPQVMRPRTRPRGGRGNRRGKC